MQWITNSLAIYAIAGLLIVLTVVSGETPATGIQSSEPSVSSSTHLLSHSTGEETRVSDAIVEVIAAAETVTDHKTGTRFESDTTKLTNVSNGITDQVSSEYSTEEPGLHNNSSLKTFVTTTENSASSQRKKEHLESENSTGILISQASKDVFPAKDYAFTITSSESTSPEINFSSTLESESGTGQANCTSCGRSMALFSNETTTQGVKLVDDYKSSYEEGINSSSNSSHKNLGEENYNPSSTESSNKDGNKIKFNRSTVKRSAKPHLRTANLTSHDNQHETFQSTAILSSSTLKSVEYKYNNLSLDKSNSRSFNNESASVGEKYEVKNNDNITNNDVLGERVSEEEFYSTSASSTDLPTTNWHSKDTGSQNNEGFDTNSNVSEVENYSVGFQHPITAPDEETSIPRFSGNESNTTLTYSTEVAVTAINQSSSESNSDQHQNEATALKVPSSNEELLILNPSDSMIASESAQIYHFVSNNTVPFTNSETEMKTIVVKPATSLTASNQNQSANVKNSNIKEILPVAELSTPSGNLSRGSSLSYDEEKLETVSKNKEHSFTITSDIPSKDLKTETNSLHQKQAISPTMPPIRIEKVILKAEVSTGATHFAVNQSLPQKNAPTELAENNSNKTFSEPVVVLYHSNETEGISPEKTVALDPFSPSKDNVTNVSVQYLSAISNMDDVLLNDSPTESVIAADRNANEQLLLKKSGEENSHSKDKGLIHPNSSLQTLKPQSAETLTNTDTQQQEVQNRQKITKTNETLKSEDVSVPNDHPTTPVVSFQGKTDISTNIKLPAVPSFSTEPSAQSGESLYTSPQLQNISESALTPTLENGLVPEDLNNKGDVPITKTDPNPNYVPLESTQPPENISVEVSELSNASTPLPPSTTEATTKRSFAIRKPKLKPNGDGDVMSMFSRRRPTTTSTKRPSTSGVTAPVSIFGRSRTRRPSITSSTTHRAFVRPITQQRAHYGPVRIIGTETFSFSLPQTTIPPTTTEAEEEDLEEDIVELQEDPSVNYDQNETFSDDDELVLLVFSASTVVEKGIRWRKQLHNRPSPEYKKQEQRMHRTLERIFRSSTLGPNLWKIKIDGFIEKYPGSRSVEVDYFVYLVKSYDSFENAELVRAFNEQLINNTFSRYTFNPAYTQFHALREEKLNKPTEAPEVEPPIPQWAIAVIVVGTASFIFIVLFAAVTMYGRHHMKRKYASKLDDDLDRSEDSRDWERKLGAAGAYENLAADVVYDAEDNIGENGKRSYFLD